MLDFFKKLVGLPTSAEKAAAQQAAQAAPYKIEKPEDQLPPVKFPVDGGIKAFQPKAPKNAANKPKVNKAKTASKPKAKKVKK